MNRVSKVLVAAAVALLLVAGTAFAGNFSPKIRFALSSKKAKANPGLNITVQQDDGEEELDGVSLRIPAGFNLPGDAKIPNGTELGSGDILIAAGPACRPGPEGAIPLKEQLPLPVSLKEQDRTDEQADSGVKAVWLLDVTAVKIALEVRGSKARGWTLKGAIPPNDNTCTPFDFNLAVNPKAGSVPILTNPSKPGRYVFSATFSSADSPTAVTLRQVVKITR